MKLTKIEREQLRNKYKGKCAYCGCDLPKKWHADHVQPVRRKFEFVKSGRFHVAKCTGELDNPELDTLENLTPACPECNIHKGSLTVEEFRRIIEEKIDQLIRYSKDFRFAVKFNQLTITKSPIVFHFERVSNDRLE